MSSRESGQYRIKMRKKLYETQNKTCVYCKSVIPYEYASLDHIIPVILLNKSLGKNNLVMCCKSCNVNKGRSIVFSNLYDRVIYPMVDIPDIFKWDYIVKNKKDKIKKGLI